MSKESVTGVAESLEAIAALAAESRKKLDKRSCLQGQTIFHDSLVQILDHMAKRVGFYQEVQKALGGAVEYNCESIHQVADPEMHAVS